MKLDKRVLGSAMMFVALGVPVGGMALSHTSALGIHTNSGSRIQSGTRTQEQSKAATAIPATSDDGETNDDGAATPGGTAPVSPEQAKAAALAAYPGTSVLSVDLDQEDAVSHYDVRLNTGIEVGIDATTETMIGTEQTGDAQDEHDATGAGDNEQNDAPDSGSEQEDAGTDSSVNP